MKKQYIKPALQDFELKAEDIIAKSMELVSATYSGGEGGNGSAEYNHEWDSIFD